MYIDRKLGQIITNKLNNAPAVALIGPRQCGKSTLAKTILSPIKNSNRSEIDLVLEKANKRIAIEFKVSTSPRLSKGFYNALKDIEAAEAWIIAPIKEMYPLKRDIWAAPLWKIINHLRKQS